MTMPFRLKQSPIEVNTVMKTERKIVLSQRSLKISHSERLKLFSFNYKAQTYPALEPV